MHYKAMLTDRLSFSLASHRQIVRIIRCVVHFGATYRAVTWTYARSGVNDAMLKRLNLFPLLTALEAGVIGLFFIQALRLLIGLLYSNIGGATVLSGIDPAAIPPGTPVSADPTTVTNQVTLLAYLLALPLASLLIGQFRIMVLMAVIIVAIGRALMPGASFETLMPAAALTVTGGLLYIALIVRHRLRALPYFFVLGFSADQVFRAIGNTFDPSWSPAYREIQVGLSVGVGVLSLILLLLETRRARMSVDGGSHVSPDYGLLPFWGAVGLSGALFLELALLALPNAVAGRGDLDYTILAPFLVAATLLPVIPAVRGAARNVIGTFDGGTRGWLWLLMIVLALVIGLRVGGFGAVLVLAQFLISMTWWWVGRPKAARERNLGGVWLLFSTILLGLLIGADNFTYDYAFVRDFVGDFRFLNDVIPPLLRGFRGLGIGVILLAAFIALLPMIQTRRRVPWTGGTPVGSIAGVVLVAAVSASAAYAARPPLVAQDIDEFRIATYNIHSGYGEFYDYNLEAIAQTIEASGATVVLLQEIDAGRLTSLGVDQPLWLARRLRMDRRFFPTNEGLQGLAVLSRIPIAYDDGNLLPSIGVQTGVQRVQIQPQPGVVVTLYNTWLSPLLEVSASESQVSLQEQDQNAQLNALFGVVAAHHPNGILGRTVIGGTFNNVPDSELLAQMRIAGFQDPFSDYPIELGATFVRTGLPRARFDYLWLRNLQSFGINVQPNSASDHRLAVVGITLTPP